MSIINSARQSLSDYNSHLPDRDQIIFPRCGLTLHDLVTTAKSCRTKKVCAAKLGVSDSHLDRVIKKHDLEHLFSKQAGELFAGVTAAALLKAAYRSPNMREAALALGVSPDYFARKVKQIGASQYFKHHKPRKRKVCKSAIAELAREGYTRRDTAYLLDISNGYLKDLIEMWGLAEEFIVRKGKAALVTQRGYCR